MAARPYVPGVIKFELAGTIGSHNWAVILHAQWTGATPSVAALQAFAGDIVTAWDLGLKASYPTTTVLATVTGTDISSSTGNQGISSPNQAGTNAGAEVTGNAALLVTYPSSFRYRGGHPRSYFPPLVQAELATASTWSTGALSAVGPYIGDVLAVLNSATSGGTSLNGQCAVSYVTAKAPRAVPVVMPIALGAYVVQAEVASQRRRIGRK